jgi:hypothetical protein
VKQLEQRSRGFVLKKVAGASFLQSLTIGAWFGLTRILTDDWEPGMLRFDLRILQVTGVLHLQPSRSQRKAHQTNCCMLGVGSS